MPARKSKYTVDTREIAETIALAHVTGDEVTERACYLFCKVFNIPLDTDAIKAKIGVYEVVAQAVKNAKK